MSAMCVYIFGTAFSYCSLCFYCVFIFSAIGLFTDSMTIIKYAYMRPRGFVISADGVNNATA